jgi:hypothetical protein
MRNKLKLLFNEQLQGLLGELVITRGQRGAARDLDIPLMSLQRCIAGKNGLSLENMQKVANYFNKTFIVELKIEVKPEKSSR